MATKGGKRGGGRVSGDKASSTAGKVLANGGKATKGQAKTLAASVLSQDPKKGPNKPK